MATLEEWRQQLLQSYSQVEDLKNAGLISDLEAKELHTLGEQFKVRVTPYYARLMDSSADCPIRKQAIPQLGEKDPILPEWARELSQKVYQRPTPWHSDSIGDIRNLAAPRITHRYKSRAIIHLSSMCAVYCRFCFRKSHLNDEDRTLYEGSLDPALQYLKDHTEIREVILTGGDPLSITDAAVSRLLESISQIKQIRTVRFHSRMAVTLPFRFTEHLIEILSRKWPFHIALVSHFNHPKEITAEAKNALSDLRRAGVTLLNQSVLLNGINAEVDCLETLFQGLYEIGVIPYYLHHPDWTPGTFHFRLSIEKGREMMKKLRGKLSGPALPDYILDTPRGIGKVSLLDDRVKKIQEFPLNQGIQGALYQIESPATRTLSTAKDLYLDLF